MGTSVSSANSIGILIPYPASQAEKALETHNSSKIKLMLTGDLKTNQIGWLSVWCRKYKINFGHVNFPAQGIKILSTKYRDKYRNVIFLGMPVVIIGHSLHYPVLVPLAPPGSGIPALYSI